MLTASPTTLFQSKYQHNQPVSTAKAFGSALLKLGSRHKNIIVLASHGSMFNLNSFELAFPERYFNFGNAESNMLATAAGFAARGKIIFICGPTISVIGRAWEQLRNTIALPYLNVKIVSINSGLSSAEAGATHQVMEDFALTRVMPNMKVVCPADAIETKSCLEAIVNDFGPAYLRLNHNQFAQLYVETYQFAFATGQIYKSGTDVCIFAIGNMMHYALEAVTMLERDEISAMLVNMASLKPIDTSLIVECARQARHIFTVEDHQIIGGLGSAVMEVLSSNYPAKVCRIGMEAFGESGKLADLYRKYRLDGQGIYERIKEIIGC